MPQQVVQKCRFVSQDTYKYLSDILVLDKYAVMWKTSEFTKRNFLRLLDLCGNFEYFLRRTGKAIAHGAAHVLHGLKGIFKDGRWLVTTESSGLTKKY